MKWFDNIRNYIETKMLHLRQTLMTKRQLCEYNIEVFTKQRDDFKKQLVKLQEVRMQLELKKNKPLKKLKIIVTDNMQLATMDGYDVVNTIAELDSGIEKCKSVIKRCNDSINVLEWSLEQRSC